MQCTRLRRILIGAFREEEASEILLLNVSATAIPADAKWTQWYYLRFEPFKSGETGTYILTQWEEKMQIGKKVYAIMKIYSTKDEAARYSTHFFLSYLSTQHICYLSDLFYRSGEHDGFAVQTSLLVLRGRKSKQRPMRMSQCAAAVRMRDQKCPICRAGESCFMFANAAQAYQVCCNWKIRQHLSMARVRH